ncbi:enoyl-CoA hydratase/isomerase family protein [Arthrobacter sp. ISL-95]|uniref:enoyl-CoA hydratase/isomerase family protein n=1 Tax=Arthrobacter sp. ISL-95 TaxID=2819116 RepID=UPI001BEA679C|nr:enoyl-CoA hydratase/isomerase family protein [Arthrobacter sp. ISL-95]
MTELRIDRPAAGVLRCRLDGPDTLNALDDPVKRALVGQIVLAATEPEVRVLMSTGAGRAFCSGGDELVPRFACLLNSSSLPVGQAMSVRPGSETLDTGNSALFTSRLVVPASSSPELCVHATIPQSLWHLSLQQSHT